MVKRKDDMSKEKPPKVVFPEGWRVFTIVDVQETTSKAGNEMFIVSLEDKETNDFIDVYCVATQGKRWLLKSLLGACGIAAAKDGVYEWELSDILEKEVQGKVKNELEDWVNREGETITTTKSKIVEFKAVE